MAYLWFTLLIIISVCCGLLYWYTRKLIQQYNLAIENLMNFQSAIDEYEEHLNVVLSMENYAGEPTIENLLKHTKDISNQMKEIGSSFSIEEEE